MKIILKNKRKGIVSLIIIVLILTIIVSICKIQPEAKAQSTSSSSIKVTYLPGDGGTITVSEESEEETTSTVASVTVAHEVKAQQTCGDYDYTDGKIVLMENGENGATFNGGTTTYNNLEYDRVLTGWKLVSVTKSNGTVITEFEEPENQNYADKANIAKDIGTVYAQNGWYIVPDDVIEITVEAVYGRAIYIRSPYDTMYYDEYHIFYYGENSDGTSSLNGTAEEKSSDDNYGTSPDDAISTLKRAYALITASSKLTVYDTVLVMCGDLYEINYHPDGAEYVTGTDGTYQAYSSLYWGYNTNTTKPFTITSSEEEKYTFYMGARQNNNYYFDSSVRLDNIITNTLSTNQIKDIHETSATTTTYTRNMVLACYATGISFEATETVESPTSMGTCQVRYHIGEKVILNGGRWSSVCKTYTPTNTTLAEGVYVKIGGLAYLTSYVTLGCTTSSDDADYILNNPASLSVTGGVVSGAIYGSGYTAGSSIGGNVNIFISGGKLANIYGAGYGSVYAYGNKIGGVKIIITGGEMASIYGAGQFYTAEVTGDVDIDIKNATITGDIFGGGKGRNSIWKCHFNY